MSDVIAKVRSALGRSDRLTTVPVPPEINEPVVRLVHTDIGLPDLFARSASANKMNVEFVAVDDVTARVVDYLKGKGCRRIGLPVSPLLERLNLQRGLKIAGFDALRWDKLTLDAAYDLDATVTDVYRAVAETGSLVMKASPNSGKVLSLVPPIHVAILEPKNFVPDLVDVFEVLTTEGPDGVTFITGPSKTADIEGRLVTGVHGPGVVQLFVLQ